MGLSTAPLIAHDLRVVTAQHDTLLAACKAALPIVEKYAADSGPCDHAVNICVCGIKHTANQLRTAIEAGEGDA